MLTKNKIPLLILLICVLELLIYLWAVWVTEPEFVTNKCARNAGRASTLLNLTILLMVGYYGLKQIYLDEKKKDIFRILITLFTVNHLIHFYYVFQNFKFHTMDLSISDNKHGFVTFIFIVITPIILWACRDLNKLLYIFIILHLFNVSYFIMDTMYNKIKPDIIIFHYWSGIVVTIGALLYIVYRVFREYKLKL